MTVDLAAATAREAAYPRRWLAAIVMVGTALMDMVDITIVNVALPTIGRDLGASGTQLEWVVSAYMLAFAAALITAGLGVGFSPLAAGLTTVAFSVGSFLLAPQAVALAERFKRLVLATGGLMLAAGAAAVRIGADGVGHGSNPWPIVPGLVIAGAGLSLLIIPLFNVVLAAVPSRSRRWRRRPALHRAAARRRPRHRRHRNGVLRRARGGLVHGLVHRRPADRRAAVHCRGAPLAGQAMRRI
jgi:MFS family permease